MTLLVFGRSGQVATELARQAPGAGFADARFLDRQAADLTDPEACAAAVYGHARGPGAGPVIIAAAWTAVDRAEAEEAAAATVNGAAPGAIARACAEAGLPLLHVSTDYVFNGSGDRPWREDDATGPLGAYGRTKLAGEQAVRAAFKDSGTPYAILRTSWVFSAHGANFVKIMLRLGAERDALRIVADQVGGPTPAADIAAALLVLARRLGQGASGGTYHFAGQPDVSWAGFARAIFDRAGLACAVEEIPTAAYPTPAVRPLNSRLDCRAILADHGIHRPDWRQGLDAVLQDLGAA